MADIQKLQEQINMLTKQNKELAKENSHLKTKLHLKDMEIEFLKGTSKYLEERCQVLNSVPETEDARDFLKKFNS